MIPAGVQAYVASTPVDFRKGTNGLMARWCEMAEPICNARCAYELTFGLHGVSPQVKVSADGWLTCDHHV